MPCHDPGPTWEEQEQERRFREAMTRLACDRCKQLESKGGVPDWAKEWWEHHKEQDRQRLAEHEESRKQEKIRRRALAKLTAEEREELGI